MRRLIVLASMSLLAACSSTRQQGYFHPTFEKAGVTVVPVAANVPAQVPVESQSLLTSNSTATPVLTTDNAQASATTLESVRRTYLQLNKAERKEVRKQVKEQVKSYVKAIKKGKPMPATQASNMDHDLKLAIIFGAIGLVALIIGGDVFWIVGGIALLIGVVFFVKWIIRQ